MAYHIPDDRLRLQDPRIPMHQNAQTCPDAGAFLLPPKLGNRALFCIASNGGDWEHVSVSVRQGKKVLTPTWDELCHVKSVFWDAEDCVVQFHPPQSEYVNMHPNVLHLWRPTAQAIPTPPISSSASRMSGLSRGTRPQRFEKKCERASATKSGRSCLPQLIFRASITLRPLMALSEPWKSSHSTNPSSRCEPRLSDCDPMRIEQTWRRLRRARARRRLIP